MRFLVLLMVFCSLATAIVAQNLKPDKPSRALVRAYLRDCEEDCKQVISRAEGLLRAAIAKLPGDFPVELLTRDNDVLATYQKRARAAADALTDREAELAARPGDLTSRKIAEKRANLEAQLERARKSEDRVLTATLAAMLMDVISEQSAEAARQPADAELVKLKRAKADADAALATMTHYSKVVDAARAGNRAAVKDSALYARVADVVLYEGVLSFVTTMGAEARVHHLKLTSLSVGSIGAIAPTYERDQAVSFVVFQVLDNDSALVVMPQTSPDVSNKLVRLKTPTAGLLAGAQGTINANRCIYVSGTYAYENLFGEARSVPDLRIISDAELLEIAR